MHPYHESPKIIILAGPRCSGKTHTGERIASELGFACISQDHIRLAIQEEQKIDSAELFHPASKPHYKKAFMRKLREVRFSDIVIEGARMSQPFVFDAFTEALVTEYGQYVIAQAFYLLPPMPARYDRYSQRLSRIVQQFEKERKSKNPDLQKLERFAQAITSGFDAFPDLPDRNIFQVTESPEAVFDWIHAHLEDIHPLYPAKHAALIAEIASSNSPYSPFYQTLDIRGERIVQGQTLSHHTWDNITRLGIDWKGKQVCEVGCNNGYFLFKAEEQGAVCTGYDVNQGSIDAANSIKRYVGSSVRFEKKNVSQSFDVKSDILMALNVLHYIPELDAFVTKMATQSTELILEIGEKQIEQILPVAVRHGHTLRKTLASHRQQGVLGRRVILHLAKTAEKRMAGRAPEHSMA
ncbi:MAG: methyltransferase [Pseudomonadota bacterium]